MGEAQFVRGKIVKWNCFCGVEHEALVVPKMAETENVDKRPKCVWPISSPVGKQPCGSEEGVFKVSGRGKYTGRSRESDICRKHLPDAIKSWDYESAVPISDVGGKK